MAEIKVQAHARIDKFYREKYNLSTYEICKKLNYSEQNLDIIKCDINNPKEKKDLYIKYRPLFDSFLYTERGKRIIGKTRTVLDYFKDVISGWTGEDLFVMALKKYNIDARIDNTDKARTILTPEKPTCKADIVAIVGEKQRPIELMQECAGFLTQKGYSETRVGKFDELKRTKGIYVNRDLLNNSYIVVDFATEDIIVHRRKHEKWDKVVDRYYLEDNNKKLRTMKLLWPELIVLLNQDITEAGGSFKVIDEVIEAQEVKQEKQEMEQPVSEKPPVEEKTIEQITPKEPQQSPSVEPQEKELEEEDDSGFSDPTFGWA